MKIEKIKNLDVTVDAPPSKAHTLRAIVLGALSSGKSTIRNPLLGEDQLHLIDCIRKLGIDITRRDSILEVTGNGGMFTPVADLLDVGESGVSMNFLCSIACLANKEVILTGAKSLCKRPIDQVVSGLTQLGCRLEYLETFGFPPVKVFPIGIPGGQANMRGKNTSQYFSSIAIASPFSSSGVILHCTDTMSERPYFDITKEMMADFGVKIVNKDFNDIEIPNDQKYHAREVQIEGDYSSASFFFLAAAICKSKVSVRNLHTTSAQGDKVFLDLIAKMGCQVKRIENQVCVVGRDLKSIEVDMKDVPDLVPPLSIACAFASGKSVLKGVGHLRNKECNRLQAIVEGLNKMGVVSSCDEDTLEIEGTKNIQSAEINPFNDHRIAMSFAVAGLPLNGQSISDETCVKKSFPNFWEKFAIFQR